MLLTLEEYRIENIKKLIDLLDTASTPQEIILIKYKLVKIKNAKSINEIEYIYKLSINMDLNKELEMCKEKSIEWANSLFKSEGLQNRALQNTLFEGLLWQCSVRVKHCLENNLEYTDNYLKVLKGCHKKNGYCPCKLVSEDTFCPCVENLEEIKQTGHCHCNMFKRKD